MPVLQTKQIFTTTLSYLVRSYWPTNSIIELKQQWAKEILRQLDFEIEVSGAAPVNETVVLVGNHISYLDIVVLMSIHPKVVFLSKKEVSRWPVIGAAAKRVGTLFVDRNSKSDRQKTREQINQLLREKRPHLAVFPSGTTTLDESKPWKKGIFEIATDVQLPIQTFRIQYSPLRSCAYIDNDNLLLHMMKLFMTRNKVVRFHWLKQYSPQCDLGFIEDLKNQTMKL